MDTVSYDSPDDLLRSSGSVLVYGAGGVGRAVQRVLMGQGLLVRAFLDQRATAFGAVGGIPVWDPASPEAARALASPETLVIVGVLNRDVALEDVSRTLEKAGAHRVMSFFSFYDLFSRELGDRFWVARKAFIQDHARRIEWLRGQLVDAKSVGILDVLVEQRRSGSMVFPKPDPYAELYLARDIGVLASPATYAHVVDCGAYDGDSLTLMTQRFGSIPVASCFEPDVANFSKLARRMRTAGAARSSVALWPCGVWDSATQLHFEANAGESSRVADSGTSVIQTVSLDEALGDTPPPTFIKMDIEGAEVQALLGARRIITTHRPTLAVSIYHTPTHLWQVPELIAAWKLGYSFYLRLYAHQGFDLVLYAVAADCTESHAST